MRQRNIKPKSVAKPKAARRRTICEVHREIYDILYNEFRDHDQFDEIVDKLEEAFTMAKKMAHRLMQYKHNYDDGWWQTISKTLAEETRLRREERDKEQPD